ncbi:hypothetical protein [Dactylosporangium matsuzakiense]|uniref:Uncharacterized protein n=1 Tax=Dactylosporangium matsuzakiense TaxID=53360 RepID=A0A9W6NQK3_9ACTN|nr:hypothetical protein [Dactylosporangium matsuzakiense]UWZ43895.1 hypothetical protein Dmats_41840 [Dactylosporangium matsuzakiense]GLL06310.1 hypothetical protein GCM10017581_080590 [Dactylosporangium matsuzakiense]
MNLDEALNVVSTPLGVRGISENGLARKVNAMAPSGGVTFSAAPDIHGDIAVRPVDVLLRMAATMRPQYQMDLYDVHAHWGLLRYLGLFDAASNGRMTLSAAGRRIVGNQRRVTSEELGIGFATYVAEAWMRSRGSGALTVRCIDIDVALASGAVTIGGLTYFIKQTAVKRPDYLLVADGAGGQGRMRLALLECKGTKSPPYAHRQLADASAQLDTITVGGRHLSGLAVSTVVADNAVQYYALQHQVERTGGPAVPHVTAASDAKFEDDPYVDLDQVPVEELPDIDLDSPGQVDALRLTATALRGSWATLADLAGNDDAFRRWAPAVMRSRLGRTTADRPEKCAVSKQALRSSGSAACCLSPEADLKRS